MDIENAFASLQDYFGRIDLEKEDIIKLVTEITEVPAPPFKEENRAKLIMKKFKELGYSTKIDEIGNVHAFHEDWVNYIPKVVIAAHLDTVFGTEVPIKVRREGDILHAPGVGDDSMGLTSLLTIAKYLKSLKIKKNLIFLANVGEEGLGDLRGTKYYFKNLENNSIAAFITIDGTGGGRIVNKSIGSRRYRIHFRGKGGHSFGEFGSVNPAFALGNFLSSFGELQIPKDPKSTYSVGVLKGGTSVNSIPFHVSAEIDLRSSEENILDDLDEKIRGMIELAIRKEMSIRSGDISFEIEQIGNRPAGKNTDQKIEELIKIVNDKFGYKTEFTASSTDANIPHIRGIPALSISGIHKSGRAHSLDEWILLDETALNITKRNLTLVAILAS